MEGLSYPSRTMPYYTPSEIEHILALTQQYQTTSPERILLGKGANPRSPPAKLSRSSHEATPTVGGGRSLRPLLPRSRAVLQRGGC